MVKHAFAENFIGSQVDASNGVIKGVAVITEGIANGEVVDSTTVKQIMACAQTYDGGLKVNADHRSGVFAAAGYLRNFRIDGKTLRADLFILATETNRAKLLEMAQTIPDTFGLSVSFSGPQTVIAGQSFARCTEIYSADLVSEPAANPTGLFSKAPVDDKSKGKSMATPTNEPTEPTGDEALTPSQVLKQCQEMMKQGFADHVANFTKMTSDLMSKIGAPGAPAANPHDDFSPDKQAEHKAAMSLMTEKLTQLETKLVEFEKNGLKVAGENIAKEFAKTVGSSPAVLAAITTGLTEQQTQGSEKFVELALKHFAADPKKSKVKALEAAMNEDGKAYQVFRDSGKNIAWPKTA